MRVIFSTVGLFFAIRLANAGTFRGVSLNNSTAITNNDSRSNEARRLNTCNAQTPCTNPPACCSQWGFCGLSDSHCGIGCVSGCPTNEPPPSPPTSPNPTTTSPTVSIFTLRVYTYCDPCLESLTLSTSSFL